MRLVLAIAALALLALPAGAEGIGALLAGSELQRNARHGSTMRYDLWRLNADGSLTGNYRTERPAQRGSYYTVEGPVSGTWRAEDGTLCVEGTGFEAPGRICYAVRKGGYGRNEYVATNVDTGFRWQMFIYPEGGD